MGLAENCFKNSAKGVKTAQKKHTGRRNISKKQCEGRRNGSKNGAESEKWKKILKKFRKWYRMYNFCIVMSDKI